MYWQRSKSRDGPWQEVPWCRVPSGVVRHHNRLIQRGERWDAVPSAAYYYRLIFCV